MIMTAQFFSQQIGQCSQMSKWAPQNCNSSSPMHLVSTLVSILVARTLQDWYDWRRHQPGRDFTIIPALYQFQCPGHTCLIPALYQFQCPGHTCLIPALYQFQYPRHTFLIPALYGFQYPGHTCLIPALYWFQYPVHTCLMYQPKINLGPNSRSSFCLDFNPFFFFFSCSLAGCFSFIYLLTFNYNGIKEKSDWKKKKKKKNVDRIFYLWFEHLLDPPPPPTTTTTTTTPWILLSFLVDMLMQKNKQWKWVGFQICLRYILHTYIQTIHIWWWLNCQCCFASAAAAAAVIRRQGQPGCMQKTKPKLQDNWKLKHFIQASLVWWWLMMVSSHTYLLTSCSSTRQDWLIIVIYLFLISY
jgi:hypothetical protein